MLTDIPITKASDAELADAVAENLYALFRYMAATLPGGELVETDKLGYHHSFPSNPMFKGVWRTRLNADEADAVIEETVNWFKARQAPFAFWWLESQDQPVGMAARLQTHGFTRNFEGDPGMAADLHSLKADLKTPDGFAISRVTDRRMLEDWRDVFCASFEVPEFVGQAWVDATLATGISSAPWELYMGYLNDQPVATNMVVKGAGVAGLFGVGTVPKMRGKGLGAAITLKPLQDVRDQGYRYGVLFATEMGYPIYQRLGFRKVNSTFGRYLWVNPSPGD